MERYEYICLLLIIILEEIIEQFKPRYLEKNGHVYADIRKGMCDPSQRGWRENDFLTKVLYHMDTASVGTHLDYGGTDVHQ